MRYVIIFVLIFRDVSFSGVVVSDDFSLFSDEQSAPIDVTPTRWSRVTHDVIILSFIHTPIYGGRTTTASSGCPSQESFFPGTDVRTYGIFKYIIHKAHVFIFDFFDVPCERADVRKIIVFFFFPESFSRIIKSNGESTEPRRTRVRVYGAPHVTVYRCARVNIKITTHCRCSYRLAGFFFFFSFAHAMLYDSNVRGVGRNVRTLVGFRSIPTGTTTTG